jgi:hypothetical protein
VSVDTKDETITLEGTSSRVITGGAGLFGLGLLAPTSQSVSVYGLWTAERKDRHGKVLAPRRRGVAQETRDLDGSDREVSNAVSE